METKRIGIAIYPEKNGYSETLKYMKMARKYGVQRLYATFLQMNMFSNNVDQLLKLYQRCFKEAKKLGFEITVDVAQKTFDSLKIQNYDLQLFFGLKIDVLRFDVTINASVLSNLTYNEYGIKIELQMSNDDLFINHLLKFLPNTNNLWGCQNFYPQRFTGLTMLQFEKTSRNFKSNSLRTTAYLSTNNPQSISPWPINDGTPTLEICRDLLITTQAQIMWATGLVDDLIIANSPASESEIKCLMALNPFIIELEVVAEELNNEVESKIIFEEKHFNRMDTNSYFIRSTQSRVKYLKNPNPGRKLAIQNFKVGDLVIGNDAAGLYKNELQIITQEIPYDENKNLVGHVLAKDLALLPFIWPNKKFKLIKEIKINE